MKITRENIGDHLLDYQFKLIGVDIEEVAKMDGWQYRLIMSSPQYDEFRSYAIPLLKKTFHYTKKKAEATFNSFFLDYGVTIK